MRKNQKTLIIGSNGVQGLALQKQLKLSGEEFLIGTRNLTGSANEIKVDIDDVDTLISSFHGVNKVAFYLPADSGHREEARIQNIIVASERSGIEHIVHDLRLQPPAGSPVRAHISKTRQVDALLSSSVPATIFGSDLFFENLLGPWALPSILNSDVFAYPLPPNYVARWISAEDSARFMTAAISKETPSVGYFPIQSTMGLTGAEVAEGLSHGVGRPIRFEAQSPEEFELMLSRPFGPEVASDIASAYRYAWEFRPYGWSEDDLSASEQFGVKPGDLAQWISSVSWHER